MDFMLAAMKENNNNSCPLIFSLIHVLHCSTLISITSKALSKSSPKVSEKLMPSLGASVVFAVDSAGDLVDVLGVSTESHWSESLKSEKKLSSGKLKSSSSVDLRRILNLFMPLTMLAPSPILTTGDLQKVIETI